MAKPKRNNRRKKQRQAVALEINRKLRGDLGELAKGKSRIETRDAHVAFYEGCNVVQQDMLMEIFKEDEYLYIG